MQITPLLGTGNTGDTRKRPRKSQEPQEHASQIHSKKIKEFAGPLSTGSKFSQFKYMELHDIPRGILGIILTFLVTKEMNYLAGVSHFFEKHIFNKLDSISRVPSSFQSKTKALIPLALMGRIQSYQSRDRPVSYTACKHLLKACQYFEVPFRPDIIQHLNLKNKNFNYVELKFIIGLFPHLRSLWLSHWRVNDSVLQFFNLHTLTSLEHLNLTACDAITSKGLDNLEGLTSLQSLNLIGCIGITDEKLVPSSARSTLRRLNLSRCYQITDVGLSALSEMTTLRSLTLIECTGITDQGLNSLSGLFALRDLSLQYCDQITDVGLQTLSGLKGLRILDLRWCNKFTDTGVTDLKGLTALRQLELGGCHLITGQCLEELACLSLRSLGLNRCYRITDHTLGQLKKFTLLERLDISWCFSITDKGLEYLEGMQRLKRLRIVGCKCANA